MKAVEFECEITSAEQIRIPPDIARELSAGAHVHVILVIGDGDEEGWRRATMERFAAAYAPEDSVYEKLLDEAPPR
jgi:hypothetical protein